MKKLLVLFAIFALPSFNIKAFADDKVSFNRPYFLMSDAHKNINRRDLIKSHFNKLDQNIYLSGLKENPLTNRIVPVNFSKKALANLEEIKGINAFYLGNHQLAINCFKNAELAINSLTHPEQFASINVNLAKLYFMINNLEQASFYNIKAKQYYATKNLHIYFSCLLLQSKIALANGYTSLSESIILKQALPVSGKFSNKIPEFKCFLQLGKTYLMAKSLVQAKWFFIQAFGIADRMNYRNGKIESLLLLAKSKILLKDYQIAAVDLRKAQGYINASTNVYLPDLRHNLNLVKGKY